MEEVQVSPEPEECVIKPDEEERVENAEGQVDGEEEEDEEVEGTGDKWVDVRVLEKMTLDELRQLGIDDRSNEADRRLDPPITKVIVRRLPPNITIDGYLQELSEVPQYNYIRLVPPQDDLPSRISKRSAIYINFETEQEAFWFKEKYNKMKFFDERGNSYIACVDFSFYQDVIKDPPDDPQVGTLEESEIFQNFLKKFEEDPYSFTMVRLDSAPTPEIMLEEILNKKVVDPESTPLLQFLRERSEKKDAIRRDREVRRKEKDVARREAKDRERERQREKRDKERERKKERDKERRLRKDKPADTQKFRDGPSEKSGRSSHQSEKDRDRDRDRYRGKEKDDKDKQKQSGSAVVTYSRSGNPTRWSENSGPRKSGSSHKDDDRKKSQEKLNSEVTSSRRQSKESSSMEKLLVEKEKSSGDNPSKSDDKQKTTFGRPFPVKNSKTSDNNLQRDSSSKSSNQQNPSCDKKEDTDRPVKSSGGAAEPGTTKKRIVKKVIKVKKVVKEDGNGESGNAAGQHESTESKPKKVIRVVKKTIKSDNGSNSGKPPVAQGTKKDSSEQGAGDASTATEATKETDRERKPRKGRPEIQIYRPGSLRGGAKSTVGDKDRDDNNSSNT